ncbi:MAG: S46 family peptidase [candidate division KSB1 bacterium]|nr:S46 family peptidase [candidate division KSB1 bacterium]MDZ7368091.1 S46 family peptidase [candidate division KSB1 bacterium]MDZ7405683.1 S46 family peptidase [candidate division KSB1 bacterium]
MKLVLKIFLSTFLIAMITSLAFTDEGMYPLSEIHKLNLKAKGFKIAPKDLYNPQGVSLVDAIVQVGGCTGSFVSNEGLILTNHHCAFGAVQAASTAEKDYLTNGFLSRHRPEEIPAKGYTCRITESYRDVSAEVLSAAQENMNFAERARAFEQKMKEIVAAEEAKAKDIRAEVAEMFAGKTYVLFIYRNIKDVRLVYVPPRSIGEFGGETDNWVWPRHTGDFSFMRAYVAKDGSTAEYSPDNVPYKPRRFLKIAPQGVNENDFVFILGYPGRTFRHQPAAFYEYHQKYFLPFHADWFAWQIDMMEAAGKDNSEVAIRLSSRIKGLANRMKNYRGKLQGFHRLDLLAKKRQEERELQAFIDSDVKRKAQYGAVLPEIDRIYGEIMAEANRNHILGQITGSSILLSAGYTAFKLSAQLQKDDLQREPAYMNRNLPALKSRLELAYADRNDKIDLLFLKEILRKAARLPDGQKINAVETIIKKSTAGAADEAIDKFVEEAHANSRLRDAAFFKSLMTMKPEEIRRLNDPFIEFAAALEVDLEKNRETERGRQGALAKLFAQLIEVKQQWKQTEFIPDANGTLRLTFGRIRGYSPNDAVAYAPITTVAGVYQKNLSGHEDYIAPAGLLDLWRAKDFGRFKSEKLQDVPVAILYDTDTTGGNSGSPVLNANGELVGVNFDRAYEATINDYQWSTAYSRSIAVDIRYVLWVVQKFAGAGFLLQELGVK